MLGAEVSVDSAMKILLVNKFHYKKGGSETYYFTLADALETRGHEVIFFAMHDEKNLPCRQEPYFVSYAAVDGGMKSRLKMVFHIAYSKEAYRNMKKLLIKEQPDLIILNLVHKQITLSILDAVKEFDEKLPIFWIMHDLITVCPAYLMLDGKGRVCEECLQKQNFWPCVKNRCIRGSWLMSLLAKYEADFIRKRKWYEQVDLYICPSHFYESKLKNAGFTRRPIVALHNPLPSSMVEKPQISYGGYFLYFGRLSREKGIYTLLQAIKKTGSRLLLLGSGPEEAQLKKLIRGIDYIKFGGFQTGSKLIETIRNSSYIIIPSVCYENSPYSAMEAMGLGKPLIVSDRGGLPELVQNGINGYVYPSQRGAEALAESIRKAEQQTETGYREMCEASYQMAQNLFDSEQYVEKIEEYYHKFKNSYL